MSKIFYIVAAICFCVLSNVNAGLLEKIAKSDIDSSSMPGYTLDFDQVFKISSGSLKGKTIVFAFSELGGESQVPKFVLADGKNIVDQVELATVENGWNIVSVDAVMATAAKTSNSGLRILAILTLEPMSGRSSDYWQQGFVFDINEPGKIDQSVALNTKISEHKPRIKTLKALKKFVEKN